MNQTRVSTVKRSQKESLLLKELSKMIHELSLDDSELTGITISKVQLSRDKGVLFVFFFDQEGQEVFKQKLRRLVLYKPALRKGIAQTLDSRYVPNLRFVFDKKFEKQQKIESILDQVKKEF